MTQNKILTTDDLVKRGWTIPNICYLCQNQEESVEYLFSQCDYTLQVRLMIMQHYRSTITFTASLMQGEMQELMREQGGKKSKQIYITKCFLIWRERCTRIFREIYKTPQKIQMEIIEEAQQWF
jgi:zinc-binding in reverse transcriptase